MAPVVQSPITRVPLRCTPEAARVTVAFEVANYSLHKGLARGKSLRSPTFSVGGYEWCIRYYPNGHKSDESEGYVSVILKLVTKNAEARATYTLKLVEPVTGKSVVVISCKEPVVFDHSNGWGCQNFMKTTLITELAYVRDDDCLVIECEVEVIKDAMELQLPSSSLSGSLAKLLLEKKGADVAFSVQGEVFSAHKIVLAMRSPVFDAEFYGPMGDKGTQDITVEDMQPAVFRAFLQFIYTDSMPSMDDLDADEKREMVKHLLVAADKYGMEPMKMACEGMLCKSLNVQTLVSVIALADQHHCSNLKDACIEFMLYSGGMDDVMASQGYINLKRSHPGIIVDVFERAAKSRKFCKPI